MWSFWGRTWWPSTSANAFTRFILCCSFIGATDSAVPCAILLDVAISLTPHLTDKQNSRGVSSTYLTLIPTPDILAISRHGMWTALACWSMATWFDLLPLTLAYYWPGLATKLKHPVLWKKTTKTEIFQNINQGLFMMFCFGPPEFNVGHLNLSVTGLDGPPIFKT